jgi:hypothetical protein
MKATAATGVAQLARVRIASKPRVQGPVRVGSRRSRAMKRVMKTCRGGRPGGVDDQPKSEVKWGAGKWVRVR